MRLNDVRIDRVEQAIQIYLDHAYARKDRDKRAPRHDLPVDAAPEEILAKLFQREVCEAENGVDCVRYSMRLGNRNYPFMKLVLQEHIVEGEYYFMVDTHDHMDIKPDYPDYEAWQAVRRFNNELKREIERDFAASDVPTASCIREAVRGRDRVEVEAKDELILVVDDEEELAQAVVGLLEARGYRTATAEDGPSALHQARELLPDLLVLDYELPEKDGLEVLQELRSRSETAEIPVLLCTSSRISVEEIGLADGFLSKPFQESLLNEMVDRLLARSAAHRREGAS